MLFAIIDYIKYRNHKDHYSFKEIENEGGILAKCDNFPDPTAIKPFSSLFYHPFGSFISWLIMYYTGGVWSHYAIFIRNGYLSDQTTEGSINHPFVDYLDGRGYVKIFILNSNITEDKIDELEMACKKDIGKRYNYPRVINMFFQIILGFRDSYKLRFTLDILILSAMIISFLKALNLGYGFIIITAIIYIMIVILNVSKKLLLSKKIKF
jgi:hypothetical protein